MNCKPGDLVICVQARAFPQLVGRIFKVTKRCEVHPDSWETEPEQFVGRWSLPVSFADYTLRRINNPGDDETDEMVLKVGKPDEVTA